MRLEAMESELRVTHGKSALVENFPWAAAKANRCETMKAADLQFVGCYQ